MYDLNQIKEIHLEVTTKCQARCPMCPRRINGGMQNPLFALTEIDLNTFKIWFDETLIRQLDSMFLCGNLGDPIMARDCLEIIEYIRTINLTIQLTIHTNGSARNIDWWKRLSRTNTKVSFGIDGLADTHHLYRINTDWYKIMENAQAFIDEGGHAEWQMLAFDHNEHQIDECRKLSEKMKFRKFNLKHTSRFIDDELKVLDDDGRTRYILKPTKQSEKMILMVAKATKDMNPKIHCKAQKASQLYISANGTVSPCCWLDYSWVLHNKDRRIDYMDRIGMLPSLKTQTLVEIFNSQYFKKISDTWNNIPLRECSRQCGVFDKLGEQFAN